MDSMRVVFSICDHYDKNDLRLKDSLKVYGAIALNLAERYGNIDDKILAQKYYTHAHLISDTAYYFTNMSEMRDHYIDQSLFQDAARQEMDVAISYAYHLDMEHVRSHSHAAITLLDKIDRPTKEDLLLKTLALYYIANSYLYGDSYVDALDHALMMKEISDEHNLNKRQLMSYETLGKTYSSLAKVMLSENAYGKDAQHYYKLFYERSKEFGDVETQYGSAFTLGAWYLDQGKHELAQIFFLESLELSRQEENTAYQFNNVSHLAENLLSMGKIDEAKEYISQSRELAEQFSFPTHLRTVQLLLADLHYLEGDLAMARQHAIEALQLSESIKSHEMTLSTFRRLEKIETADKNFKQALKYDKAADLLHDSLLNESALSSLNLMRTQYNLVQKEEELSQAIHEQEIQELRNQSRLNWLFLALALLSIILIWQFYKVRNERILHERNQISLQQKLLRSQLNPHFIFNTIASIQNYLYEKSDLSTALHFMSKFGDLMRQILEHTREETIALELEIETLRNYLELQLLRYNNAFSYSIKVADSIDPTELKVPPLIAQPFVENAIEHGQIAQVKDGHVEVSFGRKNGQVQIIVKDNGRGLQAKSVNIEKTKGKKSLSTVITKERLQNMAKMTKRKYDLIVNYDDDFTTACILLPLS